MSNLKIKISLKDRNFNFLNFNFLKKMKIKMDYQKLRGFMSRLSSSFFVVIAIMPFAGLLLGVGSLFSSFEATKPAAQVFTVLGGSLFNNFGIFFALAIIVGFNKDVIATISCLWAYFIFIGSQYLFLTTQNADMAAAIADNTKIAVLFYNNISGGIANVNLGVISLNTGVFGGILVGAATHITFNRFKNIKLPSLICFFEGKRFVPLVMIPVAMTLSLAFLIVWPLVNMVFDWIGTASGKLPAGLDSGIIFFIWRILTPFGLHHAFYSPFWWTSAGGSISMDYMIKNPVDPTHLISVGDYLRSMGVAANDIKTINGDSNIWFFLTRNNISLSTKFYASTATIDNLGPAISGINPGRFLQGNFPFMIGGYIGAGFAMYQMAKPEFKKEALAMIASAVGTSFLIGVTEPVLFMFIFIAPILFFGFHSFMAGLGAMLLNLMHCHIGTAFSCGMLDLIIYGILPMHLDTNWYMALIPAVIYLPIYYFVFLFYMKKTGKIFPVFETVGSEVVNTASGKDAYRSQIGINYENLADGLGGVNNIKTISNCATRLRLSLFDAKKIDEKLIKTTGALHIVKDGNELQVIYGPKAQTFAQGLEEYTKANGGKALKVKTILVEDEPKSNKARK